MQREGALPFPLHVLFNPVNQGYGGNQKIGYHYAIERGFDFVALLHGDGQYAPECLPDLRPPAARRRGRRGLRLADAGEGRRAARRHAALQVRRQPDPERFQNRMLGVALSEFHSGYRVYSVAALAKIPFELNTNDFHFDTEIIIQLCSAGLRIVELPIPTYYGDEICHVNGLKYAWDVTKAVVVARSQQLGSALRPPLRCRRRSRGERAVPAEARLREPALSGARLDSAGRARPRSRLRRRLRRRDAAPAATAAG